MGSGLVRDGGRRKLTNFGRADGDFTRIVRIMGDLSEDDIGNLRYARRLRMWNGV